MTKRLLAIIAVAMIVSGSWTISKAAPLEGPKPPAAGTMSAPQGPELHWTDYRLGDSPKDSDGVYEWTKREAATAWQHMPYKDNAKIDTHHAWFRSRVQKETSSGAAVQAPYLLFASARYEFEVYSGTERIFRYGNLDDDEAPMLPGKPVFVPLDKHSPDKPLFLRVQSKRDAVIVGKLASVWYGNEAELKMRMIQDELPNRIGMLVFFLIGLVSLLLHFINRDHPAQLYFALFCLSICCNFLLSLDSLGLFVDYYTFRMYAEEPLQGIMTFLFALYFIHALKPPLQGLARKIGIVCLLAGCLMPIVRLLIPQTIEAYRSEIMVAKEIGLSLLCALCLVVIALSLRRKVSGDAVWFIAGFSLYLLIHAVGHPLRLLTEYRLVFFSAPPLTFVRFLQASLDYSLLASTIFFGIITIRRYAEVYRTTRSNNIQLANWNHTLEMKVNERTQAIQNLLDYAGQGFLTFNDRMIVQDEYSAECRRLFGRDVAGAVYADLIELGDEDERSFFAEMIGSIFQEDELHREVVMSLLPAEADIQGKRVLLQYKWIPAIGEASGSVMAILTDISERRQMEIQVARERQVLNMVVWVIKHYRDFKEMLDEYRLFASEGLDKLLQGQLSSADLWEELHRAIHTFKGNFAQLDFTYTTERLHELESQLEAFRDRAAGASEGADLASRLAAWLKEFDLLGWLEEDLRVLRDILGDRFDNGYETITIEIERLRELEQQVYAILPSTEAKAIVGELKKLRYRPFRELLGMYPEYALKLAERLGKALRPIEILGGDVLVDPDVYLDFVRTLVHVFRNMIDHGIETPEERAAMGKERMGTIACRIADTEKEFELTVSNNGREMNVAEIGRRALETGICTTEEWLAMPYDEQRMLIFREGFSTRQSISKLSGRGIGLFAVRKALEDLGGTVRVESEPDTGTKFTFLIPRRDPSPL